MHEMGDPEWASWEIFAHRGLRGENWDVLEPRLAEWMATRSCDELMDLALRERLPFAFALAPPGVEELEEELSGSADVRDWLYRSTPSPQSAPPAPPSPGARAADLARPLEGVTVLDLSTVWATPLSTAQLAHFGARVIKVESQYRLDHTRSRIGELSLPDAHLPEWDRKGSFRETNQGKESATVNLGTAEGQRLLLDLAGQADVIVSNFTPGVAERLGLSAEALWEANPGSDHRAALRLPPGQPPLAPRRLRVRDAARLRLRLPGRGRAVDRPQHRLPRPAGGLRPRLRDGGRAPETRAQRTRRAHRGRPVRPLGGDAPLPRTQPTRRPRALRGRSTRPAASSWPRQRSASACPVGTRSGSRSSASRARRSRVSRASSVRTARLPGSRRASWRGGSGR